MSFAFPTELQLPDEAPQPPAADKPTLRSAGKGKEVAAAQAVAIEKESAPGSSLHQTRHQEGQGKASACLGATSGTSMHQHATTSQAPTTSTAAAAVPDAGPDVVKALNEKIHQLIPPPPQALVASQSELDRARLLVETAGRAQLPAAKSLPAIVPGKRANTHQIESSVTFGSELVKPSSVSRTAMIPEMCAFIRHGGVSPPENTVLLLLLKLQSTGRSTLARSIYFSLFSLAYFRKPSTNSIPVSLRGLIAPSIQPNGAGCAQPQENRDASEPAHPAAQTSPPHRRGWTIGNEADLFKNSDLGSKNWTVEDDVPDWMEAADIRGCYGPVSVQEAAFALQQFTPREIFDLGILDSKLGKATSKHSCRETTSIDSWCGTLDYPTSRFKQRRPQGALSSSSRKGLDTSITLRRASPDPASYVPVLIIARSCSIDSDLEVDADEQALPTDEAGTPVHQPTSQSPSRAANMIALYLIDKHQQSAQHSTSWTNILSVVLVLVPYLVPSTYSTYCRIRARREGRRTREGGARDACTIGGDELGE
ncbi:hypothetical protein L226DRAFT_527518 [Lentinus tigrinus ALCF2SS1-7]|uniref:Uncharacterized protein n=1 Tax=Lentinus tigrinus ALCF2SS1-6 TaxID=1328759 RepID=A0A5C2RLF8_9APHY|nr:hypothetical protein L227DRAFT_568604 [Lentinus tigrinus ALCF2SS1-6]RPD67982.1 hypothetical protein L226DRAFT_527518 [Lentinus tigrinus ALCF2SS1-7]